MIEAGQSWPPLCGAVAGCGALLALAGTAKLIRTAGGTGDDTAVGKVLRLSGARWRIFQAGAGIAELVVGVFVCAGVHPAVTDTLMACQGAAFVALLAYAIRDRVPGGCGCVTRRRPGAQQERGVTRWSLGRAVFIALAGVSGAAAGVRPPSAFSHRNDGALGWAVALIVLTLLVVVDLELRTPRCRRSLLFPTRTRLAEVTTHDVYRSMAASLGARHDRVLFRRIGCIDEFWFPAGEPGPAHAPAPAPYLAITVSRAASGVVALRAAVAERAPDDRLRTLPIRRGSDGIGPNLDESQPFRRRHRLS